MYELVYTSTPQGLLTGRSGFTTVALTDGFPPNLIASIENLSGYKTLFEHGNEHELRNPVNFSCQPFTLGRTSYMVLSRISYAGISYTGRSNVLAHHLIFTEEELDRIPGGAIAVLRADENFPEWSGKPRMLPLKLKIGSRPLPADGEMWQKLAGSSLWASYTAECFRSHPDKGLVLAFDPLRISGAEILELIAETAARLTQEELRHFTFSTYCYSSGITNPLFFRSYVNDSALLGSIRRLEPGSIIYLGRGNPLPESWTEPILPPFCETDKLPPADKVRTEPVLIPVNRAPDTAAAPAPDIRVPSHSVQPPQRGISPRETAIPSSTGSPQESPQDGTKIKKRIAALLMAALVFGLCVLVFWRIFTNQPQVGQDAQGADVLLEKNDPQEQPPVLQPRKTETASQTRPQRQPAASVEDQPVPKKHQPQPPARKEKTATQRSGPVRLTDREHLNLYRHFQTGGKRQLPVSLRNTAALEVKIRSVGGLGEIGDRSQFIAGNKTRRVDVFARQARNSGLGTDWSPVKDDDKRKMTFRLGPDASLEIICPTVVSETTPKLADVSQITFIGHDQTRYDFRPNQPPPVMTKILNREAAVTVKFDNESIRFYMKVSDDLWMNRRFYSITVNGRNLGDINQRQILLHEVNLIGVRSSLVNRNELVKQLQNKQRDEKDFVNRNRQNLIEPSLDNKLLHEMFGDEKSLQSLRAAASSSSEQEWLQRVNTIKDSLRLRMQKQTPDPGQRAGNDVLKEVTDSLDDFRRQSRKHAACSRQLNEIRKNIADRQSKIKKQNESLLEKLRGCSPVLYCAASGILKNADDPQIFDPDFYRKISEQELKKDIKVKIVTKRNTDEFR